MIFSMIGKMIFQDLIKNGVEVIDSNSMLKAHIVSYLINNNIVYTEADTDMLISEVKKYLTIETFENSNQDNSNQDNSDIYVIDDLERIQLCEVYVKMKKILEDIAALIDYDDLLCDISYERDALSESDSEAFSEIFKLYEELINIDFYEFDDDYTKEVMSNFIKNT
jgi:hypothetical protein